jgi:DNA-binding beta-propeller fold protein YncE
LHFPSTLDSAHCILDLSSLGLTNTEPADIAVDPNNQFIYVTMSQDGSVLRLDPPSLPAGNAPLPPSETSMLFDTAPLPPSETSPPVGNAPLPPSEP